MLPKYKILMPILFSFALTATNIATGASVYKWTDENGTVHYGDRKPDGKKSEKLRVSTGSGSSSQSGPSAVQKVDEINKKEEAALEQKAQQLKDQQRQAAQEERCKAARAQVQNYKSSARMRVLESNGEYRFLSEEEKAAKQKGYEKIVADECGG